ncbi:MAG: metalloregulator ArsR/SmtB family transcription factor [Microbacterium sp.]
MTDTPAVPRRASAADIEQAAQTSRLLAEPTRLGILLALLHERDLAVGELAARVDRPIAAVSQHLAKLKSGGLVRSTRDGASIRYRLGDEHVIGLVENLLHHTEHLRYAVPPHHRAP